MNEIQHRTVLIVRIIMSNFSSLLIKNLINKSFMILPQYYYITLMVAFNQSFDTVCLHPSNLFAILLIDYGQTVLCWFLPYILYRIRSCCSPSKVILWCDNYMWALSILSTIYLCQSKTWNRFYYHMFALECVPHRILHLLQYNDLLTQLS